MSITPPTKRLWWNEPVAKVELVWIVIAFIWGLFMFFMMIYWHGAGEQNLSNEAYRIAPENFVARVTEMVEQYQVTDDEGQPKFEGGIPVVHPPAGSDIYLLARTFQFWPILELEKDKVYRLHLSSMDYQHGFSLQPVNINLSLHPGYDMVLTVTPDSSGLYNIVCNEYCGLGHHFMVGRLYVVD